MKTIRDVNIHGKTVILRVDYNVPLENNKILDNTRIVESLDTIKYLLDNECKIIILSHKGKIKTIEDVKNNSLLLISDELSRLLSKTIKFCPCLRGEELKEEVNNLYNGDILLLENTRFLDLPSNLESGCDEELSTFWASLADIFVFDAFGCIHRNHASTLGIAKKLPSYFGFLVEKEINELDKIKEMHKTLLLGGSKVSDKIGIIKSLVTSSDKVLIGGALASTFLKAKGVNIGNTIVDNNYIEECKELLSTSKVVVPVDYVMESSQIFDIGEDTIELFKEELKSSSLVVMNGTLGKYEVDRFSRGTKEIIEFLKNNNIKTVVLGGDAGAASKKYEFKPYYTSTGGGASLEYLEGKHFDLFDYIK